MMGTIGAIWGLGGILLLLISAVYRLFPYAFELRDVDLSLVQLGLLAVFTVFMIISEGYRGFQKQFSPRVAARAKYLYQNPKFLDVLFAPLFCMAYFHASRKRKIVSFSITGMIIVFIILVKMLEQPWRGIIDTGVVAGLGWGILSVVFFSFKAFSDPGFDHSPEVE